MIFAEQLRAARALLGWSQQQLADCSKVGIATIRRIEAQSGPIRVISETLWRLQTCLENSGIQFIGPDQIDGPGVRLSKLSNRLERRKRRPPNSKSSANRKRP